MKHYGIGWSDPDVHPSPLHKKLQQTQYKVIRVHMLVLFGFKLSFSPSVIKENGKYFVYT